MGDRSKLVVAIALLSIGAGLIAWNYWPEPRRQWQPRPTVFIDLATGDFFEAPQGAVPPMDAPSGAKLADGSPAGVRPVLYGCGGCDDPEARFIAWVETYTPEDAKYLRENRGPGRWQAMRNQEADDGSYEEPYEPEKLVAPMPAPGSDLTTIYWSYASDPEGKELEKAALENCPEGVYSRPCYQINPLSR